MTALLAMAAMLLAGLTGTASAAPVGKDGKILACYKVKGKPRGSMRLLFKGKRCKRGERRVTWVAAGSSATGQPGGSGQPGTGSQGPPGSEGATGAPGVTGSDGATGATLSTQVATLSLQVEGLEKILEGLTNGELTGVVNKLTGLTNGDLTGAVNKLTGVSNADLLKVVDVTPVLESACELVFDQSNLLRGSLGGLVGVLAGSLLGPIFGSVSLPAALDPSACAAP